MKKNKRTLKKRIRKYTLFSFLVTTVIFSSVLVFLLMQIMNEASFYISDYFASKIADEMTGERFFKELKIDSLTELKAKDDDSGRWRHIIDSFVGIRPIGEHPGRKIMIKPEDAQAFTVVFAEIQIGEDIVYSNKSTEALEEIPFLSEPMVKGMIQYFENGSSQDLIDQDGTVVGSVRTEMNPTIIITIFGIVAFLIATAFVISFIFALLLSHVSTIPIIGPIRQLEKQVEALVLEDYETTLNTQIELKKPLREIEAIATATNKIMKKMREYNLMFEKQNELLENQNTELEAQNIELTESRKKIEEAQERLVRQEKSVRNLLDNAGQGFLSFGRDLLIDSEYSQECIDIFGQRIENTCFSQLMSGGDVEQEKFIQAVLEQVFQEKDHFRKEIYLPLLPDELAIQNRIIRMEYKLIGDIDFDGEEDIMVILTDITDRRSLESQIEEERNILKMVVKVVVNYNEFMDNLTDYHRFCSSGISEILSMDISTADMLSAVYREIHTFKGSFAQYGLAHTVEGLHALEGKITEFRNDDSLLVHKDVKTFLEENCSESLIEEDMEILKDILGIGYFDSKDMIIIDKHRLLEIEKKMLKVLSPHECRTLLPDIRKLRFKSVKEVLHGYGDYVERLSANLQKSMNPLIIEGGDFLIDSDQYSSFFKSLVHVFRNTIDHGIEYPEERVEMGKEETGTIRCKVELTEDQLISLIVQDDGRGIDVDAVKMKALEKELRSEEELASMNEEEVLRLIFEDGFTIKEYATELSGRGVGLAAVKKEAEKLGGAVEIFSTAGSGTEIRFLIPYESPSEIPNVFVDEIMYPLIEKLSQHIGRKVGEKPASVEKPQIHRIEKMKLSQYTVFIGIRGMINGKILISVNENMARKITRNSIIGHLKDEEEKELIEHVLAEFGNQVVGNSMEAISSLKDVTNIEVPIVLRSEDASFVCPSAELWTVRLPYESDGIDLSFATMEKICTDA
ncbi:MAG: ATP-binding protein [Bacillota bacterium]